MNFFMADSGDHIAGKTGLEPTVTISKTAVLLPRRMAQSRKSATAGIRWPETRPTETLWENFFFMRKLPVQILLTKNIR